MPDINDAFPSNYLKASDLKGTQPIVTIDRVEYEDVGRKKERKPILYFVGKDKGLVLNKTNANVLIKLTESALTEDWHGHRICLFATMVEFAGDQVEAIRIKAAKGAASRRPAPPKPEPDDHFVEPDDDEAPF